jgi:hypothetical protein
LNSASQLKTNNTSLSQKNNKKRGWKEDYLLLRLVTTVMIVNDRKIGAKLGSAGVAVVVVVVLSGEVSEVVVLSG